ncbi:MAG: glycoside hydrolase family 5 protein [Clostridia bacterium]|nr:glycoside hydrolase family 5 protein [Clostridia bacterium]
MKKLCLALMVLSLLLLSLPVTQAEEIVIPELNIGAREVPDNEALRFTRSMGVGWNLGNTLEAYAYKGYNGDELGIEAIWCGTMTTEGVFDALKAAGMNTVRIPVSWHDHVDENLVISEAWLERVAEVASWGYERGMHVIINIHHDFSDAKSDTTWIYPTEARYADSERYVRAIWQQVAERFRDWDDRLILESMNEPRLVGTSHEWMYVSGDPECEEAMECINRLNQVFVDTVRATGGYNATRYLMVPAYDASPECAVNPSFRLPEDSEDNRIIVSVHAYTPYDFALNIKGTASFRLTGIAQTQDIVVFMNRLYDKYVSKGVPVVIGEFGALRKKTGQVDNVQARVDFTAFYAATAAARNLPCLLWDNHAFNGSGENFGVLNRRNYTWKYPQIIEAMVRYGLKTE